MTDDVGANEQSGAGGCLKVLAIAVPVIALAVFLFMKLSQASGHASEVSEGVVNPYLEQIRAGEYQKALDEHGSPALRKKVSASQLKAAYEDLAHRYGRLSSFELYVAQEQHSIGSESIIRARYTLKFEKAEEHVAYDISGEGAAARIDESYERVVGGTLRAAPR